MRNGGRVYAVAAGLPVGEAASWRGLKRPRGAARLPPQSTLAGALGGSEVEAPAILLGRQLSPTETQLGKSTDAATGVNGGRPGPRSVAERCSARKASGSLIARGFTGHHPMSVACDSRLCAATDAAPADEVAFQLLVHHSTVSLSVSAYLPQLRPNNHLLKPTGGGNVCGSRSNSAMQLPPPVRWRCEP
jgi:hypothetical protein